MKMYFTVSVPRREGRFRQGQALHSGGLTLTVGVPPCCALPLERDWRPAPSPSLACATSFVPHSAHAWRAHLMLHVCSITICLCVAPQVMGWYRGIGWNPPSEKYNRYFSLRGANGQRTTGGGAGGAFRAGMPSPEWFLRAFATRRECSTYIGQLEAVAALAPLLSFPASFFAVEGLQCNT